MILAWVIALVRGVLGHRELLVFMAVPALYLTIAYFSLEHPGPGDITLQLANRGLAYMGIIALVPVAALLALAARRIGERAENQALVVVCRSWRFWSPWGSRSRTAKKGSRPSDHAGHSRFLACRRATPSAGPRWRPVQPHRDYPAEIERVGMVEPARWLAWASGVDTLNTFNPETSNTGAVAYTGRRADRR